MPPLDKKEGIWTLRINCPIVLLAPLRRRLAANVGRLAAGLGGLGAHVDDVQRDLHRRTVQDARAEVARFRATLFAPRGSTVAPSASGSLLNHFHTATASLTAAKEALWLAGVYRL